MITQNEKEGIITEYLTTEISFRALGKKYGVDFRTINKWVQLYRGKMGKQKKDVKAELLPESQEQLPTDVKHLQEELRKARLLNEVLTEVINIAEEKFNLPIRKKYGTRQS